jgi:electron transfer flavoprotein beta subunit
VIVKIAVLIKQVPSSEARIRIAADGRSIDPQDTEHVVNPYDEFAMEAALQVKEKFGGEIVVIGLGSAKIDEALRTCLALGGDKAVALKDEAFQGSDSLGAARILSTVVKRESADLVLCGKLAIDFENAAVGPMVAELLDFPHVNVVSELEFTDETHATVTREIEGGTESFEVELPIVLTATKGLNEPRYAALKGIMMAKKKPLESPSAADLGIDVSSVGAAAALTTVTAMEPPAERAAGQVIDGDPADMVAKLVSYLKDEAKVL